MRELGANKVLAIFDLASFFTVADAESHKRFSVALTVDSQTLLPRGSLHRGCQSLDRGRLRRPGEVVQVAGRAM